MYLTRIRIRFYPMHTFTPLIIFIIKTLSQSVGFLSSWDNYRVPTVDYTSGYIPLAVAFYPQCCVYDVRTKTYTTLFCISKLWSIEYFRSNNFLIFE